MGTLSNAKKTFKSEMMMIINNNKFSVITHNGCIDEKHSHD